MWVYPLCIIPCEHHIQRQITNKRMYAIKTMHHADFLLCAYCGKIKYQCDKEYTKSPKWNLKEIMECIREKKNVFTK
jgi:Fe2+ or Zn2+ uptake regulation protein